MKEKVFPPHKLGRTGEAVALEYLKRNGFRILQTGFRMFRGEIDIIASEADVLVFIEVKTRRDERCGVPEESVNESKRRQIRKIAEGYLLRHNTGRLGCRFDVVAVTGDETSGFRVRHFRNAFE